MKIGVVDVAAEQGGALTILKDFHKYIFLSKKADEHEWFFFTSVVSLKEKKNIVVYQDKDIKKNIFNRLYWEYVKFPMLAKKNKIDVIISLQNKALPVKKRIHQITYFHNLYLIQKPKCYGNYSLLLKLKLFLMKKITMSSFPRSDLVIVQAEFVKKKLLKVNNNLNIKVVIPNIYCKEIELEQGKSYLGWIYPASAHDEYRQHLLIIEAVRYLISKSIDIDFEILFTFDKNESPYARKVYEEGRKYKQIKFIGKQDRETILNMYTKYGLVIASEFETCCLPMKEAIFYNSPILGFKYEYALETVGKYKRSYLCEIEDYKELAMKMLNIKEYAQLGSLNSNKKSSWSFIMEELEKWQSL